MIGGSDDRGSRQTRDEMGAERELHLGSRHEAQYMIVNDPQDGDAA